MYREGDVIHLTAIVKCLLPDMEVFHSAPGTAFSFKQPEEHREQELIGSAKAQIEARWVLLICAVICSADCKLTCPSERAVRLPAAIYHCCVAPARTQCHMSYICTPRGPMLRRVA